MILGFARFMGSLYSITIGHPSTDTCHDGKAAAGYSERMDELSINLRSLRETGKLSQAEIGRIVGVTRGAVSQWETGKTVPSMENLIMLAKHFKVPLTRLTGTVENVSVDEELQALDPKLAAALRATFLVQIAAVKRPSQN